MMGSDNTVTAAFLGINLTIICPSMASEVSCFPGFFFFFCSKESFYVQEVAEKLEE